MTGRLAHSRPTAGRQAHGECTDPGRAHGRRMAGALPAHGAHTASKHATPGPRQASWPTVCPWQAGGHSTNPRAQGGLMACARRALCRLTVGTQQASRLRWERPRSAHGGRLLAAQPPNVGAPMERPRRQTAQPEPSPAHPVQPTQPPSQPACQPSPAQHSPAKPAEHGTAQPIHDTTQGGRRRGQVGMKCKQKQG